MLEKVLPNIFNSLLNTMDLSHLYERIIQNASEVRQIIDRSLCKHDGSELSARSSF